MRKIRTSFLMALLGVAMATPTARAQQQGPDEASQNSPSGQTDQGGQPSQPAQPSEPIHALRSPLASEAGGDDSQNPESLAPDTRPLAGAQDLSLGVPAGRGSTWRPHVSVISNFEINPPTTNGAGWGNWTSILGGIDVSQRSEKSNLTLTYTAGGSVATNGEVGSTVVQEIGGTEQLTLGRSVVSFFDALTYLPGATFGYAGTNGIPIPGGGGIGLSSGLIPDQGILTLQTQSLSNAIVAQDQTFLTRRTSFTFLGGYNLLHYFGGNLINSDSFTFQGGYNYELSRADTLAVSYRFTGFRYGNANQSTNIHGVQGAYGRRLTGRLALRVSGGLNLSSFQTPITGSSGSGGTGNNPAKGPLSQHFFSLNAGLSYQFERTTVGFTYSHGISAGSGVLAGAVSNFLTGTASRQLSPKLRAGLSGGYSRNTGQSFATTTPSIQSYNYTYVNANLSRPWGRSTTVSLSYEVQYQNSSAPPCVGTGCPAKCTGVACSNSYVQQGVYLNLTWNKEPMPF